MEKTDGRLGAVERDAFREELTLAAVIAGDQAAGWLDPGVDWRRAPPEHRERHFVGRVGADVLTQLPGVTASTGSACHAGSVELSPVLAATRVPPQEGMGAVRFSLGRATTWEDLQDVLWRFGAGPVRHLPGDR
jgi:hypothetical protein